MPRPCRRRRIASQRVQQNLRADKTRRSGSVLRQNPVELRKGPRMVLNWLQTSGRVELVHVGMRQTSQSQVPANHYNHRTIAVVAECRGLHYEKRLTDPARLALPDFLSESSNSRGSESTFSSQHGSLRRVHRPVRRLESWRSGSRPLSLRYFTSCELTIRSSSLEMTVRFEIGR